MLKLHRIKVFIILGFFFFHPTGKFSKFLLFNNYFLQGTTYRNVENYFIIMIAMIAIISLLCFMLDFNLLHINSIQSCGGILNE